MQETPAVSLGVRVDEETPPGCSHTGPGRPERNRVLGRQEETRGFWALSGPGRGLAGRGVGGTEVRRGTVRQRQTPGGQGSSGSEARGHLLGAPLGSRGRH